jgi:hypothetical protein
VKRRPGARGLVSGTRSRVARLAADESGMVSVFVVAMTVGILAIAGLSLDGGLALADKVRALGQAEDAARAGAQQIDLAVYRTTGALQLDPQQAQAAAQRLLAADNATGTVTVDANTVIVTVTATEHTQLLGLVGITTLTVTATGKAVPQSGVNGPGN